MAETKEIAQDFQFLRDRGLAVLIFGSSTAEEGRDTDICIVAPDGFDLKEAFKRVDVTGKKYDVWIFEELPLYMKMEVIEDHLIVICEDVPELFEYFYHFRKLWKDQEHRNRLTKEEINSILEARKLERTTNN